jgi:hypothetical protein
MNEQQKKDLANQSVARLHQIRASLLEAEKKEEEALGKLTKSAEETPARRLAVERDFLRTRVELYNEQANILSHLVNDIKPAIDDAQVMSLAKDVDLAAKLSEKRQQAGSKEHMVSKDICGSCTDCTTACTDCVTNACLTCITNTCLHNF